MKYRFQYFLIKPFLLLIQIIPRRAALQLAKFAGGLFFSLSKKRRKIALENLSRAFLDTKSNEEKSMIAKRSFQSMAMSLVDLMTVDKVVPVAKEKFEIRGLENYQKALSYGKGVVLEVSHIGSWEYMAFLFTLTKTQCSVIVKDIRNPYLDRDVNQARRLTGLNPVPKQNSLREILKRLKHNETAAILIDQWAGPEGIWGNFFSEKTSTTTLPYRLAIKTGCALLPGFCIRSEDDPTRYVLDIQPPVMIDPQSEEFTESAVTRKLNEILESKIREYPGQWTWGHRRWKGKPQGIREMDAR